MPVKWLMLHSYFSFDFIIIIEKMYTFLYSLTSSHGLILQVLTGNIVMRKIYFYSKYEFNNAA